MKPKLLLLSYYWPPAGGAGVQRWLKFVKYLHRHGYDVTVITVDENAANYPQRDEGLRKEIPEGVSVISTKTSEPFGTYKKVTAKKETPYGGFSNQGKKELKEEIAKFIRGNFFLPDARKGWNKFAVQKAREVIRSKNIDILITTSPPHSTQLAGRKLKNEFPHLQWIADLRDPWTGIYYYQDLHPTIFARIYDRSLEKKVITEADDVLVVSRNIRSEFARHVSNAEKIKVIPNGYDQEDFIKPAEKEKTFTITYTGTISNRYPVKAFLESLTIPGFERDHLPALRFVGTVPAGVKSALEEYPGKTEFTGQVTHEEAIKYMQSSSILLLLIPDAPGNKGILTGKLFEYIGSKTPVLCVGPEDGEAAEILRKAGAGKTFDPGDKQGIAGFIRSSITDFEKNALSAKGNGEDFSRENLTMKLEQLFRPSGQQG